MSSEQAFYVVVAATVIVAFLWARIRIKRYLRRRKPPQIHPKLEKYQQSADVAAQRRREAAKIVATSSTGTVAGYRIVRQIEAVFVDGFRRPEEAVEGLKATAAMKGANGVTNVRHQPSGMGKYSASGDAVVLEPPGTSGQPEDAETSGPK